MRNRGKKNVVVNKEEPAENWCFVCKDGGDLRICDYKDCLKSYHPSCVGKEDSFLKSEVCWACDRHTCSICHRYCAYHCYTCPNSVCRRCYPDAEFLKVKGKYGFCSSCRRLALLIEENKNYDSDGERVDFNDIETYEGLFKEYYLIIKAAEEFESGDLYTLPNREKVKKKCQSRHVSEELNEVSDEVLEEVSGGGGGAAAAAASATDDDDDDGGGDDDDDDDEEEEEEEEDDDDDDVDDDDEDEDDDDDDYDLEAEKKRKRMRKSRFERQEAANQISSTSTKLEFIGWASTSLFEFLTSIGKSTGEKLSQRDVAFIVNDYVKENKLFNPEKKRIITCDERLQSLFKRKTISRYRINDLLEAHFAENHDESEDDDPIYDSEDKNADISDPLTRKRKLDTENKTQGKEVKLIVRENCFASIEVENIKLVYLKRGLLRQLLKQPESFEEKVVGCFVRVKSDPQDYRSRHSYQLVQVKGVKKAPNDETSAETVLQFYDMPVETCISLISDDDFTEEECEGLKQKMLSGQLERPKVGFLEEKAKLLLEDMTKYRIAKELTLLQHLINHANEKGWRREMFEYLDKKKRLQDPSELQKLLENVPTAIPDLSSVLGDD